MRIIVKYMLAQPMLTKCYKTYFCISLSFLRFQNIEKVLMQNMQKACVFI